VTTIDRDTVQFGSARHFHASVIGTARKSSIATEGGFIVRVDHKLTPFLELEAAVRHRDDERRFVVRGDEKLTRFSNFALLIAFGSLYHRRPNGNTSKIRSTPR
jgi:hypothetical protein